MKVIRIMFDNPITVQAGEQINVEYTVSLEKDEQEIRMEVKENPCYKCEHYNYCDWWNVCTGDCKDCWDKESEWEIDIKLWCKGDCLNKRNRE